MISAEDIRKTVEEKIEGTDRFVVEVKVKAGNRITVLLDSDTSVSIDDCIALTRHIESVFDREKEDYDLTVSSAGIDQPFRLLRQYIKNIGREVEVRLKDNTVFKGKLVSADENCIKVYIKTRIKKVETGETREIPFTGISQTTEIISFK